MTDGVAAAAGLLAKGWSAAQRVALDADTTRLRALSPGDGIREFLALAELAQQLAPAASGQEDHLAALVRVAAAFHWRSAV